MTLPSGDSKPEPTELPNVLDRILHPLRRTRARRDVAGVDPRVVLFVCQGNLCRSPFAAALFEREWAASVGIPLSVMSAGFVGTDRAPPPEAIASAAARGIDLSNHRSRLVRIPIVRTASVVIAMSPDQARAVRRSVTPSSRVVIMGDLDPATVDRRTIVDPLGKPAWVFDDCYDRITRCVRELVRLMSPSRESA